ncbi:MAG: DUF2723 domain-containing protein, partial [Chloroflexi bacterium]|nr:DUF2723 domain-containing protein [Chloroflexota bacterium]
MTKLNAQHLAFSTQLKKHAPLIVVTLILALLYLSTMAQSLVLGDPTEYTFIANTLGIAHPPGYAFITLMGKLFQTVIPFGDAPWRMHLLSATASTLSALFVFGIIRTVAKGAKYGSVAALFGALTVGTAVNQWQHAIHANPHIITATFLMANLYFLTKWWACENKWLYLFCVTAGLGITHHPLTVFAFPGYALFILLVRPSILRDWRTILKMVGFALLGLSLWLYYPLRSPSAPFGPTSMNTLNGFLDHVLARGLSDSLPYFSLAEQPQRLIVFWSILRLQFALPIISLAIIPFAGFLTQRRKGAKRRKKEEGRGKKDISAPVHPFTHSTKQSQIAHPFILYTTAFLGTYAFVISLRAQDIMAYILGPVQVVGLLAGIGFLVLLNLTQQILKLDKRMMNLLLAALFLLGPGLQMARNAPRVSLRDYNEGSGYVDAMFERFDGTNEGAVLLNDWERMTPIWYTQLVDGRSPNESDVRPIFISTGGENPWRDSGIFAYLPGGPVYLSNFRPKATEGTEFRLRPDGPFYQVLEPGDTSIPNDLTQVTAVADEIEIMGYGFGETPVLSEAEVAVTAGDFVPFTLAMRAPQVTDKFYIPVLTVGDMVFEFTTDSHLITPNWWEGEVIVERFDFALPHNLPAGDYPVTLDMKDLSNDRLIPLNLSVGEFAVAEAPARVRTDHLLANFRQRVGLVKATVRGNGRRAKAPWQETEPFIVQQGDILNVTLTWESLAIAEESYTIFVHLIDAGNAPHISLDYTP